MATELTATGTPRSTSEALSAERADRVAEVFKALSDPVRVRLMHHISANCCSSVCVCHMPADLGITQPTLSYHLTRLLKAGLISREMRGKWAHYTATAHGLDVVRAFMDGLGAVGPGTCDSTDCC